MSKFYTSTAPIRKKVFSVLQLSRSVCAPGLLSTGGIRVINYQSVSTLPNRMLSESQMQSTILEKMLLEMQSQGV